MGNKKKNLIIDDMEKKFSSGINTKEIKIDPPFNIIESEDSFFIEVELPGVKKEDINLYIDCEGQLIIKGEKKLSKIEGENLRYLLFSREFGTFYKKISFDSFLDDKNVSSSMSDGVLHINIKKASSKITIEIQEGDLKR